MQQLFEGFFEVLTQFEQRFCCSSIALNFGSTLICTKYFNFWEIGAKLNQQ